MVARFMESIGRRVIVGIVWGLAGLGTGALLTRFVWSDHSPATVALRASIGFLCVAGTVIDVGRGITAQMVQRALAASALAYGFVAIIFAAFVGDENGDGLLLLRSPFLICGSAVVGCLILRFHRVGTEVPTQRSPTRILGRLTSVMHVLADLLSSSALGAGIGFAEGYVIDPSLVPTMVQDGAALVGSFAGGLLGLAIVLGGVRRPSGAVTYSVVVSTIFLAGLISAKWARMGALFLTPLEAILISAIVTGWTRRSHPQPHG